MQWIERAMRSGGLRHEGITAGPDTRGRFALGE